LKVIEFIGKINYELFLKGYNQYLKR